MTIRLYSLREVAKELGLHPQTVKHHLYQSHYFAGIGRVIGKSLVFTDDDLTRMKAIMKTMPPPGRKPEGDGEPNTKVRQARAVELSKAGMPQADIAKELGYSSASSVSRAIATARKKPRKRKQRTPRGG